MFPKSLWGYKLRIFCCPFLRESLSALDLACFIPRPRPTATPSTPGAGSVVGAGGWRPCQRREGLRGPRRRQYQFAVSQTNYLRTPGSLGGHKMLSQTQGGGPVTSQGSAVVVLRLWASNGALGFALALTLPDLECVPGKCFLWEGRKRNGSLGAALTQAG